MIKLKNGEFAVVTSFCVFTPDKSDIEVKIENGKAIVRYLDSDESHNVEFYHNIYEREPMEQILIKVIKSVINTVSHVSKIDKQELKNKVKELL